MVSFIYMYAFPNEWITNLTDEHKKQSKKSSSRLKKWLFTYVIIINSLLGYN